MKRFLASLFLLTLIFQPALFSAEQLTLDAVSMQSAENAAGQFHAVVTGDDKLIVKPGKFFSEGTDVAYIQLPYLIGTPKPILYPRWALHQGWQGELTLAVEILTSGKVGRLMVMKSSGREILDKTALEAVKTWKFHPAMEQGKAVLTCIQIPVQFQIDSKN